MGGRRRLKANAPRLLGEHSGRPGRAYRRAYDALEADLGPFASELVRFEAGRVAVAMLNLEASTSALATARRIREAGRGRRPSARDLERLSRRQGLADATYAQALDKLRGLANGNGHRSNGHRAGVSPEEMHRRLTAVPVATEELVP